MNHKELFYRDIQLKQMVVRDALICRKYQCIIKIPSSKILRNIRLKKKKYQKTTKKFSFFDGHFFK